MSLDGWDIVLPFSALLRDRVRGDRRIAPVALS